MIDRCKVLVTGLPIPPVIAFVGLIVVRQRSDTGSSMFLRSRDIFNLHSTNSITEVEGISHFKLEVYLMIPILGDFLFIQTGLKNCWQWSIIECHSMI